MGQKVNPTGIRLGIVKDHASVWYAERGAYADKLNNNLEVRSFLEERLKNASVSRIHIERLRYEIRLFADQDTPNVPRADELLNEMAIQCTEVNVKNTAPSLTKG